MPLPVGSLHVHRVVQILQGKRRLGGVLMVVAKLETAFRIATLDQPLRPSAEGASPVLVDPDCPAFPHR